LIELMVVVTLIAVATAGVSLSLRDSAMDALERDAERLAAVLESARAQSRASGAAVFWQAQASGYALQGLPRPAPAQAWLSGQTRVQPIPAVVLGPEPLIPPQQIELYSANQPQQRLWVQSDGLRPFAVQRSPQGDGP
jgi:general secretion pathway protein H